MRLNELKPKAHSKKRKRIVGRGNGSGLGTYAGYGSKGAKARSGGTKQKGFEGGQTPLFRRLPKLRGFTPINRTEYIEVNIELIEKLSLGEEEINLNELMGGKVKVLGRGEINKPITVKASKFSKTAKEKIESAKGKVEVI